MKCSESWLREWVNPSLTQEAFSEILTMGGIEVEEIQPASPPFSGVVVGKILSIKPHPNADTLKICEVTNGSSHLQIVCGAQNIHINMLAPLALNNASLPGKKIIQTTTIQGISSDGMLCSAKELGLTEEGEGLLELPNDAPVGEDIRSYLQLEDNVIEVAITPNRGDCLSVRGLAREISALTNAAFHNHTITAHKNQIADNLPVIVEAKQACARYVGRIIRQVKANVITPTWLKERLRRSGIRSISPIVDVTNYVMLEIGQPMHAFDLATITKNIIVRTAKNGEKILLLDDTEQTLDSDTLVIADQDKPLAIAGVMGGLSSSVTLTTQDIFLESAYFSPEVVARQQQRYHLSSDSAYRFERGVDPTIQREAIERASELIVAICGGQLGSIIEVTQENALPKSTTVTVNKQKITDLLGVEIEDKTIENIFDRLKFHYKKNKTAWEINIPIYRRDIILPEDIIEEIARLYGYANIPTHAVHGLLQTSILTHNKMLTELGDLQLNIRQLLSDWGFHEIISYSFVDKRLQNLLDPNSPAQELLNPISADMSAMRTNLWPGLVNALLYNLSRQQQRVRLFEMGVCFNTQEKELQQIAKLAGLITGSVFKEQWGEATREVDFYDLKGTLENLLARLYPQGEVAFKTFTHPALHPGQTAAIFCANQQIGILGGLHPQVLQTLDVPNKVFVFEMDLAFFANHTPVHLQAISKFPEIRRDIAILVKQTIPVVDIQDTIRKTAGDWLKDLFIFDVYQGKGIAPDTKSVALGLILQHPTRTLVDTEVASLMERVITALKGQFGAELRS